MQEPKDKEDGLPQSTGIKEGGMNPREDNMDTTRTVSPEYCPLKVQKDQGAHLDSEEKTKNLESIQSEGEDKQVISPLIEEAEKRKLRRQELLEKQKKASESDSFEPWKAKRVDDEAVSPLKKTGDRLRKDSIYSENLLPTKIRENLVENAIKFLVDPKVSAFPPQKKKAFLESKGLSKEEINLAFTKVTLNGWFLITLFRPNPIT
ncbi:peroxisomal membrane protein pex14, variant 2 [Entomophthora muscae]|uniref:Peroxisomal membrane protein pex14, variant 2 n=1 Tax=Entomophthora muscae TaxID=34485 RepID=A0ACC2SKU2_9FUNG|nr:peroxisomal membrane protein pex14, variant 2 [Entomophthora muscae]